MRDRNDPASALVSVPASGGYLASVFSGVENYIPGATAYNAFAISLYRSGTVVTQGNVINLFQPRFDTFTSHYDVDGFLQGRFNSGAPQDEGTLWTSNHSLSANRGADGLDGEGIYGGGAPSQSGEFGADDLGEREVLPPFLAKPQAVKVTLRLNNPSTRQVMQRSMVFRPAR